jgi:hypothetical protein
MVYSRSRSAMVNWLRALSKLAPVPLAVGAFLLTQQLRQLGDVGGDAPGLVIERAPQKEPQAAKPLGVRRAEACWRLSKACGQWAVESRDGDVPVTVEFRRAGVADLEPLGSG